MFAFCYKNEFSQHRCKNSDYRANKTGKQSCFQHKCGYCGQPISAESGTSRTKEKKFYYKCNGRKKYQNGCTKITIKKELLEEFVIEFILGELKCK